MGSTKKNGWAIASLISGILAFILIPLGVLLASFAIIAGYIGQKRKRFRALAVIGMILGVIYWIGLVLAILTGAIDDFLRMIGL
ncbi:MAG: hypothetical protein ACMUHU_01910 [Thermoplasmatota archaeon]